MKLEEVNQRTKEAVDFLVAALESGNSEVLTADFNCLMSTQRRRSGDSDTGTGIP
jgi:hypothetical protein